MVRESPRCPRAGTGWWGKVSDLTTDCVRCSRCGAQCSQRIIGMDLMVRAFVECPECLAKDDPTPTAPLTLSEKDSQCIRNAAHDVGIAPSKLLAGFISRGLWQVAINLTLCPDCTEGKVPTGRATLGDQYRRCPTCGGSGTNGRNNRQIHDSWALPEDEVKS